jgi:hypothetical protein
MPSISIFADIAMPHPRGRLAGVSDTRWRPGQLGRPGLLPHALVFPKVFTRIITTTISPILACLLISPKGGAFGSFNCRRNRGEQSATANDAGICHVRP